jgi:hypothetical protein
MNSLHNPMKFVIPSIIFFYITITGCGQNNNEQTIATIKPTVISTNNKSIIDAAGTTLSVRFNPPAGFKRKPEDENSFAYYLRNLPLKPSGSKVRYFNGDIKPSNVYEAVVDMPISNQNLHQCADAVIRLRAEYFYSIKAFDRISFNLTNGFKMAYSKWMEGYRVVVNGNETSWKKQAGPSNSHDDLRNYLEFVYMYAGTLSLSKSMHTKSLEDMAIGDVFIKGGSPGHAVLIVDLAENEKGEKVFLLAQSYMPAQETQILKNNNDPDLSPWYSDKIAGQLITPEWTFDANQLKTW